METINSNPLDHSVNYDVTGTYTINPLDVGIGGWQPNFIQQGWQCPCCGRVYSPNTPMCLYCGNYETKTTTTTVTNNNDEIISNLNKIEFDERLFDKTNFLHEVTRLILPLRNPYRVMRDMNYDFDKENKTLEGNVKEFLKTMEKENRLEELYNLLNENKYK